MCLLARAARLRLDLFFAVDFATLSVKDGKVVRRGGVAPSVASIVVDRVCRRLQVFAPVANERLATLIAAAALKKDDEQ